jgi:hypothetical protein
MKNAVQAMRSSGWPLLSLGRYFDESIARHVVFPCHSYRPDQTFLTVSLTAPAG